MTRPVVKVVCRLDDTVTRGTTDSGVSSFLPFCLHFSLKAHKALRKAQTGAQIEMQNVVANLAGLKTRMQFILYYRSLSRKGTNTEYDIHTILAVSKTGQIGRRHPAALNRNGIRRLGDGPRFQGSKMIERTMCFVGLFVMAPGPCRLMLGGRCMGIHSGRFRVWQPPQFVCVSL